GLILLVSCFGMLGVFTVLKEHSDQEHHDAARNRGIGDIKYCKVSYGDVINNMSEEEGRISEQPIQHVSQGSTGNKGKSCRDPLVFDAWGIKCDADDEAQLDGCKDPGAVFPTHRKCGSGIKQEVEAEPIPNDGNGNARFQPTKHNLLDYLV